MPNLDIRSMIICGKMCNRKISAYCLCIDARVDIYISLESSSYQVLVGNIYMQ